MNLKIYLKIKLQMNPPKANIEEINKMNDDDDTYFNRSPPKLERILTTHGKHVIVKEDPDLPPRPSHIARQVTQWIGKEGEEVYNVSKNIVSNIDDEFPKLVGCNTFEFPTIEEQNIEHAYKMEREINPSLVFDSTHYTGLPYDPDLSHLNFLTIPGLKKPRLVRQTNDPSDVIMPATNPILMRTDTASHYINPFGRL